MRLFPMVMIVAVLAALRVSAAPVAEVRALSYWSSDRIRAARPLTPEPALAFDVEDTVTPAAGPAKVRHLSVTLAPSFTRVSSGDGEVLDDHALCRILAWTPGKPVLANDDCFSIPSFRVLEIHNRAFLGEVNAKMGLKAPALPAALLGRGGAGSSEPAGRPAEQADGRADGFAEYQLGDDVVARVSGAASPLDPDERRRFARYLALHVQMHPQLRRELAASALPQRLEIKTRPVGVSSTEVLVFTHVRRAPAAYPLPPHLRAQLELDIAHGDQARPRGERQAMLAIEGRSSIPKPSAQALVKSIRAAATAGRPVDGLLIFLELTQQYYGPVFVDPSGAALLAQLGGPLAGRVINDPAVQPFWAASQLAGSRTEPGDREAAARYLATAHLDLSAVRHVSLRDLRQPDHQFRRHLEEMGPGHLQGDAQGAGRQLLQIHIAAYPWSSSALQGDAWRLLHGPLRPSRTPGSPMISAARSIPTGGAVRWTRSGSSRNSCAPRSRTSSRSVQVTDNSLAGAAADTYLSISFNRGLLSCGSCSSSSPSSSLAASCWSGSITA